MKNFIYILLIALLISCSNSKNDKVEVEKSFEATAKTEFIEFSQEQIDLAGIEIGKLEKKNISETITCSGTIKVPPQNIASVSPKINGFVKVLNYYPGDKVEKGAVLGTLNHPDFITLQQQYIEAKSKVDYTRNEFKRQGELTVENAASIKKMQKAKADYQTNEALYKSLKAQLEMLGVNTQELEKGEFVKEFKILSPISGVVSELNANQGKFISSESSIYEIINSKKLTINLNVFEKDLSKIKVGQKIKFNILNSENHFVTKVIRIGIKIDESTKTTLVQSVVDNKNYTLKPGAYVNASININEKSSYILPYDAIINLNEESYVFIKTDTSFKRIKVQKGIERDDFCEILNTNEELINSKIVIKGAYYLMAEMDRND